MKILRKFTLLLILGSLLTNGAEIPVLKRAVRSVLNLGIEEVMSTVQSEIISNCKEMEEDLRYTYSELLPCIGRKQIGVTPKQEFLSHLEQCSKVAVAKTKDCLKDYQKYLPDFTLSLVKSLAEFMYYDDFYILRGEFARCVPKIMAPGADKNYEKCVTDISRREIWTEAIPPKPEFCRIFLDVSYCFPDLIGDVCGHSKDLDKFVTDYMSASKKPCDL